MEEKNFVVIATDLCKGCRLCVESCPNDCLEMSGRINRLGYEAARFSAAALDAGRCTACGICFYACPEPGAVTVFRRHDIAESVVERAPAQGAVS